MNATAMRGSVDDHEVRHTPTNIQLA